MAEQLAVRRATAADVDLVTDLIARAFAADPLWRLAMSRRGDDTAHHARLWRPFITSAVRFPWTWLAEPATAVSVWIPPGEPEMAPADEDVLRQAVSDELGDGAETYFEVFEQFEAMHPHAEPHYYLSLLATDPDHRGHGYGMRLLAHDLALLDAEGVPAYLESSNIANNPRYERLGFAAVGQFTYAGGPVVTGMWRVPR
jgi:GNAT superfamily N-acetyltransferase